MAGAVTPHRLDMRQGPQSPREVAQFTVGILRSRLWQREARRSARRSWRSTPTRADATRTRSTSGCTTWSGGDGITTVNHALQGTTASYRVERILDRLFELRRAEPRDDLVSSLVATEADGQLTPRELLAMCQLLLVAGFETTVNLISNAVLALQRTPGAPG